ncbi:MAG TPA: branched-chain amino acid ABC transporter permease [Acidimicrobiia bacterium]|nr:branched-chain amino acid ABC transporter permease [Acidimicrobiia bacterium]
MTEAPERGTALRAGTLRRRWPLLTLSLAALVFLVWWILQEMSGRSLLIQTLNGLSFGAVLFFLASGFTLIFGLMRITNLAHGGFYLVGGYIGFTVIRVTGNFVLALLSAGVGITVIGLFTERVLLRPIRGLEKPEVLLTIGLTFVLGDLALAVWGGDPTPVPVPGFLQGPLVIGGFVYPRYRLFVVGCAVAVAGILFYIERRTRIGAIVRAGVDDRKIVAALGINIEAVFTGVFMLGAFLAGFAGVIGGGFLTLLPGQDFEILLFALVVVILGGLGSLPGAVLGAVLVGLIDSFGKAMVPELSFFTLFAPMALILMLRPQGLLGREH